MADCILEGDAIRLQTTQQDQSSLVFNNHGDLIIDNPARKSRGAALVVSKKDVLVVNYQGSFKGGVRIEGDTEVRGNVVVTGDLIVKGVLKAQGVTLTQLPEAPKGAQTRGVLIEKKTGKLYRST